MNLNNLTPSRIGDRLPDGAVYAGVSPDTGKPFCAMPEDHKRALTWADAMSRAPEQTFGGHQDWRLPTIEELVHMYRMKNAIGGFYPVLYWSSTTASGNDKAAWRLYFGIGSPYANDKRNDFRVRYVRDA